MLSVSHHFFDIRLSQGTLRSSQCAMTHESRMIVIIHIISSLAITFSVVYLFMDILSIMRLFTFTLNARILWGKCTKNCKAQEHFEIEIQVLVSLWYTHGEQKPRLGASPPLCLLYSTEIEKDT